MKAIIFCILLFSIIHGQTSIPVPPDAPEGAVVEVVKIIGDFDGDASNDLLVGWDLPSNSSNTGFSVYSFKKKSYLMSSVLRGDGTYVIGYFPDISFGDVNNDEKIEMLYRGKIYEYSSTISKKKIP